MKKTLNIIACLILTLGGFSLVSCQKDEIVTETKSLLMEKISEAENLLATTEEGLDEGNQAAGSKRELQAKIDQAYYIMENTDSDEAYSNALELLSAAMETYRQNTVKAGIPHFGYGANINLGSEPELAMEDGYTIECMARFDDLSAQRYLFATEGSKQGFVCRTQASTGKIQFTLYTTGWMGSAKWSTTALETGKWYHIAVTYTAPSNGVQGAAYLYINGKREVDITGLGSKQAESSYDLQFGASACYPDRHLEGDVQHIAIWDDARTDEEVASDAAASGVLTGNEDDLIGYWPLTLNRGTEILDETGNYTARLTSISWKDAE